MSNEGIVMSDREAFEAAYKAKFGNGPEERHDLSRTIEGYEGYDSLTVDYSWWSWQAALEHCKQGEPIGYVSESGLTNLINGNGVIVGDKTELRTIPLFAHAMPKSDGVLNPYSGSGVPAENWNRGYNGARFIGINGSDAHKFYLEGKNAKSTPQPTTDISELVKALSDCVYAMEHTLIMENQELRVYTDYSSAMENGNEIIAKHTVKA